MVRRGLWLGLIGIMINVPIEAAILCAQKSGAIKLREVCKKNESPMDLIALGLQTPGVIVKDTHGTTIGPLASLGQSIGVFRKLDVALAFIPLDVGYKTFREEAFELLYESQDCQGPPLLDVQPQFLFITGGIIGNTFYYAPNSGQPGTIHSSRLNDPQTITSPDRCFGGSTFIPPHSCCFPRNREGEFAAPQTFDLENFILPLRAEMP